MKILFTSFDIATVIRYKCYKKKPRSTVNLFLFLSSVPPLVISSVFLFSLILFERYMLYRKIKSVKKDLIVAGTALRARWRGTRLEERWHPDRVLFDWGKDLDELHDLKDNIDMVYRYTSILEKHTSFFAWVTLRVRCFLQKTIFTKRVEGSSDFAYDRAQAWLSLYCWCAQTRMYDKALLAELYQNVKISVEAYQKTL